MHVNCASPNSARQPGKPCDSLAYAVSACIQGLSGHAEPGRTQWLDARECERTAYNHHHFRFGIPLVRITAGVPLRGPERSEGHVSSNDRVGLRQPRSKALAPFRSNRNRSTDPTWAPVADAGKASAWADDTQHSSGSI
jgi:hypothetical protein